MLKHSATIKRENDFAQLIFTIDKDNHTIALNEDNPNQIKEVFNSLIQKLKSGKFEFELNDSEDDLYTNVCKEYIKQLNAEIASVYSQLKSYNLLEIKKK